KLGCVCFAGHGGAGKRADNLFAVQEHLVGAEDGLQSIGRFTIFPVLTQHWPKSNQAASGRKGSLFTVLSRRIHIVAKGIQLQDRQLPTCGLAIPLTRLIRGGGVFKRGGDPLLTGRGPKLQQPFPILVHRTGCLLAVVGNAHKSAPSALKVPVSWSTSTPSR